MIQPPAAARCGLSDDPLVPCLFDLADDPREEHDLAAANPAVLEGLWRALNVSLAGAYHSRSPPELVEKCAPLCAELKWGGLSGPVCGVEGCT